MLKGKAIIRASLLSVFAYLLYCTYSYESETSQDYFKSNAVASRNTKRSLTIDLGNGECEWQPPIYDIPEEIDFYKTAIVGFPSGDKRMIFVQMEALTNWGKYLSNLMLIFCNCFPIQLALIPCFYSSKAAKDEWDFEFLGMSNNPFIKGKH